MRSVESETDRCQSAVWNEHMCLNNSVRTKLKLISRPSTKYSL